jgi:hypothetical protein
MLLLNTVSDLIRVITSSANALDVFVSFVDTTTTTTAGGRQRTSISSAATTTVVAAPAASTERVIKSASFNARGGANSVIVFFTDGTAENLIGGSTGLVLSSGDTLIYTDTEGWRVQDANGQIKTIAGAVVAGHVIRINGVDQTQRAAENWITTADIVPAAADDAGGGETEMRLTFAVTSTVGGRLLRAPQIVTATNAAFAHPAGTKLIFVEGVGSGGGGGGCAALQGSCGNGGNAGNWGQKSFTSISGTSNITIGAAGAGVSGAAGTNGANCSFVHNAVTLTLPAGIGGTILAGGATQAASIANAGNAASTGADVGAVGQNGGIANRSTAVATAAYGGDGGSNPLGFGGKGFGGVNGAGVAAAGHGAGGGGAVAPVSGAAAAGGAATAGRFIIWEFG